MIGACGGPTAEAPAPEVREHAPPAVSARATPDGGTSRDVRVYHGGKVYTAAAIGERTVEAIAVRGNRVVAAGASAALFATYPEASRVDLHGRTVVPGFNDAHFHPSADPAAIVLSFRSMNAMNPSVDEVRDAIRAEAKKSPGRWIVGDVGVAVMVEGTALDRKALDVLAPESPVFLRAYYGHGHLLNSKALTTLGIGDDIRDPVGGRFGRSGGKLDGRVYEYAEWITGRRFAALATDDELRAAQRRLFDDALRWGVTTIQTMAWVPADRWLRLAAAEHRSPRVRFIRWPEAPDEKLLAFAPPPDSNVRVSGIKWILDGTVCERGAAVGFPYVDDPKTTGTLNFKPEEVHRFFETARANGEQLLFHTVGVDAIKQVLVEAERLSPTELATIRPRLEHGSWLTPDLDERVKRLGLVVVKNPMHFSEIALLDRRWGKERRAGRAKSLVASGIHVAFGSDGPLNPYLNVMMALKHPYRPDEAVTREEAIDAYTRESAYAEREERDKGTLEPGKVADFVVLSRDLFSAPVDSLPGIESVLTVIDGEVRWGDASRL